MTGSDRSTKCEDCGRVDDCECADFADLYWDDDGPSEALSDLFRQIIEDANADA